MLRRWRAGEIPYGAAARIARRLGAVGLITYTLESEPGTSLRAAGWRDEGLTATRLRQWGHAGRPRPARAAILAAPKHRWCAPWSPSPAAPP